LGGEGDEEDLEDALLRWHFQLGTSDPQESGDRQPHVHAIMSSSDSWPILAQRQPLSSVPMIC